METTTIQLKGETLERLKYFKEYSKESYNEILNKILDVLEEDELTDKAIEKIKSGLKDIKDGRVISLNDYSKKRGIAIR